MSADGGQKDPEYSDDTTENLGNNEGTDQPFVNAGGDGPQKGEDVTASEGKIGGTQEVYMQKVKEVIEELDEKREADKRMVFEFRSKMNLMVEEVCQEMEQRLLSRYEETNKAVEVKLQYMNEILEKVNTLESELGDFHKTVSLLFNKTSPE